MKFKFNNISYDFPTSLADMTLRQRIEFDQTYGKDLTDREKELANIPDSESILDTDNREADMMIHRMDVACKNFAFFSGIPLEDVQKIPMLQVLNVYQSSFEQVLKEQEEIKIKDKYFWNNEIWVIDSPELSHESTMAFNEFVTAKQIVKTMHDLGGGQWESLPSLCAIFLRKEGEPFDEKFLTGKTARTEDMLDLPMDIALSVAFFLRISMSLFLKTTQSSVKSQEEETVPV